MNRVVIPTDSNLHTIESNAFSYTKIKEIFIPSKVSKICEYAFSKCKNLTKVEIPADSILETIDAFEKVNIKEFFIASKVSKICYRAFYFCRELEKVEIPTNSSLEIIGIDAFANSKIKKKFYSIKCIKN